MVMSLLAVCFSTLIPFWTTSAGRRDSAFFTRFCTSTAASSGSTSMSNVIEAENPPEFDEDELIYIIPGVPLSSCSIGVATAWVTVMASAPGYDADTCTTGGTI